MTAPAEGLTLADLQTFTVELLRCGASIDEINTLRRHLDILKGGGLVRLANGAKVVSLIISDVIKRSTGNDRVGTHVARSNIPGRCVSGHR